MSKVYNFRRNAAAESVIAFVHKVNSILKEAGHTQFDLPDYRMETNDFFEAEAWNKRTNSMEKIKVRRNGVMPSEELFSLYQELIRPADEPFAARNIFKVDSNYHPGSKFIGFDVISEEGEAELVATGQGVQKLNNVDFSVGRIESFVAKIPAMIRVLRDDIQEWELRNSRGLGPNVSVLQEKIRILRKSISRKEDNLIWLGGNIKGIKSGKIDGVFDFLSATASENGLSGGIPTHGAILTAAAAGSDSPTGQTASTKFKDKSPRAIIADFVAAAQYLMRKGSFLPSDIVLSWNDMVQMGIPMVAAGDGTTLNQTPIIKWIKEAFALLPGNPNVQFHASNYMQYSAGGATGTKNPNTKNQSTGFLMIDSKIQNQAIAVVEEQLLLPSQMDENGDLKQVGQLKSGGFQCKQPASMVYVKGIGDNIT